MANTAFLPSAHGFGFVNSWTFTDAECQAIVRTLTTFVRAAMTSLGPAAIPLALLGASRRLEQMVSTSVPDRYGLCGGMAFAALDYYRAGLPIPTAVDPMDQPPPGSPLRDYLTRRLIDSLVTNGATFLAWKAMLHIAPAGPPVSGGPRWLRDRSRDEWIALRGHIDRGEPWPLALVGEAADPFSDHQVLACGYDERDGRSVILVYDGNCPGRVQEISLDLTGPSLDARESCPGGRGALRGFFCERYSSSVPPEV